jgi:hypothetical protein
MEGVDVVNKCLATKTLTINMPNGRKVMSTHVCDMTISGLLLSLMGHIVLHLAISSFMGIRLLCNVGYTVVFDKNKCDVIYNGYVILQGYKDRSTDLFTLPINGCDMLSALPQSAPVVDCALHTCPDIYPGINIANFTHSVKTRANGVSRINCCAILKSSPYSKRFEKGSSTDAPIFLRN